jgi:autotransporter-associated beta strand protein
MRHTIKFLGVIACATLAAKFPVNAGTHIWSGAVNYSWSHAGNWSSGGAPQVGEQNITLIFPPGAVRTAATNSIVNFPIDDIIITGNQYTIGGNAVILTGASYYNLECSGYYNVIALDIKLNSSAEYFNVPGTLSLSGALSGPGGFTKFGEGSLTLSGTAGNSYASPTLVRGGYLNLDKPDNVMAIPGVLTIGLTGSALRNCTVVWMADQQIPQSSIPTINPTGVLRLSGLNQTVAGLNIQGGYVDTGYGTLTLKGNVDARAYVYEGLSAAPALLGYVSLGGAERTFHVDGGYDSELTLTAFVEDGGNAAGIVKTGNGGLRLEVTNYYNGLTKINEGHLRVGSISSLGSTAAGTIVALGATLRLESGTVLGAEPLTLSGNGDDPQGALQLSDNSSISGPVTLAANTRIGVYGSNAAPVLSGPITGPGALHKVGPGALTLSGSLPNNYLGGTYVDEGTLQIGKLPSVTAVPGQLHIGTTNAGPNSSSSRIQLLASDQIEDSASVFMEANAVFDLKGYAETIQHLTMVGSLVTNATGLLTMKGNANLDSASAFDVGLHGTAANGKYDRVKVMGSVNLDDAYLHLTQSGSANTNDQFMIIDNDGMDPINGTFKGLQQNGLIQAAGATFKINYFGGDGNDVVLTQIPASISPSIGKVSKLGNGQIQLIGQGVPGVMYSIEASEDLGNPDGWKMIGSVTADGNGVIQFTDADAPQHSLRFYRFLAL